MGFVKIPSLPSASSLDGTEVFEVVQGSLSRKAATGLLAILTKANTFSLSVTAPSFVPNGSTVPSNGIYLSAANTIGFATNSTQKARIDSFGRLIMTGATAGTVLDIQGVAGNPTAIFRSAVGGSEYASLQLNSNARDWLLKCENTTGMFAIHDFNTNLNFLTINTQGVVTLPGPNTGGTVALALPAGTTAYASIRISHGVAPTAPNDGDCWTTTGGMFVRINGVTKSVNLT